MQETDAELIARTRAGDSAASGVLWKRHFAVGLRVARSHAPGSDAEDIVAEAFARIIAALRRGSGPTELFRPYLYTVIRNIAMDEAKQRARFDGSGIDLDAFEAADDDGQRAVAADLDRSTLGRAFRSLPDRWQSILWYVDVEGVRPRQVAPLVGMQAGAVSSLAYRARRALRAAWVQEHVALASTAESCRAVLTQYGAYESGLLTPRKRHLFEEHVRSCPHCPTVVDEARNSSRAIAVTLIPLLTGGLTAKTVLGAKTAGASASATTMGAWGHRLAQIAGAHTKAVAIGGGSAVVVAAGVVVSPLIAAPWHTTPTTHVAAAAAPEPVAAQPADADTQSSVQRNKRSTAPLPEQQAQESADATTAPTPAATPSPSATSSSPAATTDQSSPTTAPTATASPTPTKTPQPTDTLTAPAPDQTSILSASDTVPLTGTAPSGSTITATVDGTTLSKTTAGADGRWNTSVDFGADATYTVTFTASKSGYTTSHSSTTNVTVDTTSPQPPTIASSVASASAPEASVTGTAEAGSTVRVSAVGSGAAATTTAGADGTWSVHLSGMQTTDTAIDATATDAAGNTSSAGSSSFAAPSPLVTVTGHDALTATIDVQGWANSRVSLAIDSQTVATLTLDTNGELPDGSRALALYAVYGSLALGGAGHTVSVTYVDTNGIALGTAGSDHYTVVPG